MCVTFDSPKDLVVFTDSNLMLLVSLVVSTLVGAYLMPQITAIGGFANQGFCALLSIPITLCALGMFSLANELGSQEKCVAKCMAFILSLGLMFATIAASWAICNSLGTVPSYSYVEALQLYGITFGITTGASILLSTKASITKKFHEKI